MSQHLKQLELLDGIFNRFIVRPAWNFSLPDLLPEGYDLVEQKDHKLTRLKDELASKKQLLQYHEKAVVSLSKEIEELEKEIKSLE